MPKPDFWFYTSALPNEDGEVRIIPLNSGIIIIDELTGPIAVRRSGAEVDPDLLEGWDKLLETHIVGRKIIRIYLISDL